MTHRTLLVTCLSVFLIAPLAATGQTWSDEQTGVWSAILESYDAVLAGDANWTDTWVHPDASAWGDAPMPRDRATVKMWDRVQMARSPVLVHSFEPAAIVVHGTMAFAHYYASSMSEEGGEAETTHTRCTDIMVDEGGSWLFIGWSCMDMDDD